MIVETALRVADPAFAPLTVVCHDDHRFLVAECLREAGIDVHRILLEPVGRNTAPAVAAAALSLAEAEPEAILLVMPSDHRFADVDAFRHVVRDAIPAAQAGYLVTFGIRPTRAETGYGYIEQGKAIPGVPGAYAIRRFVEKPDAASVERFVAGGSFWWNSGLFLFSARAILEEYETHAPAVLNAVRRALAAGQADLDFLRLGGEALAVAPAEPIDVAIMEKTRRGALVPTELAWSDIGSWRSVWEESGKDALGNVVVGDVMLRETRNSLIRSEEGILTAVIGLDGVAVVATDDSVLVMSKAQAQSVKELVGELSDQGRSEHISARTVHRPWGSYQVVDSGTGFLAKRLTVKPGAALSLQYHNHRAEHWIVVQGQAKVTRGDEVFLLSENQSTYIPSGTVHRLENPGASELHLIEVQTGTLLSEDDIVRLEDRYARAGTGAS